MAKVSLMMPVYKTEPYIEKSLRSALDQTFDDLEIVIVNDATPDGSMDVVQRVLAEYSLRAVKVIDHPTNMGSAVARQTAIDNATGDYTIHLDSDDYCEPDMVERLYECAKRDNADIVVCDLYYEYPDRQTYCAQPVPSTGKELVRVLCRGVLTGSLCNKLIRRTLYVEHNIRLIPGINNWEDFLVTCRLSFFANKVSYLPAAFLHYVKYNVQSLSTRFIGRVNTDPVHATEEMERFINAQPDSSDYADDIVYLKLNTRMVMLKCTRGVEQKKMAGLFPDMPRRYIFSYPNKRIDWKMALYFASIGWLWATNLIFSVVRVAKTVTSRS